MPGGLDPFGLDDDWVWPWDSRAGWTPAWGPVLDSSQTTLDAVGMIPAVGIFADLPNAGISVGRGDWTGASMSFGAAIPVVGQGFGGAKLLGRGIKAADKLVDGAKAVDKASDAAKAADKANDAAKAADNANDAAKKCPNKKKNKPDKSGKCKTGTWLVGNCGFNGVVIEGCDWTPFRTGNSRGEAQTNSARAMPAKCFENGNLYHHCTAFECVKKEWVPRM